MAEPSKIKTKKKIEYYPKTTMKTLIDESAHVSHFALLLLASVALTAWALFTGLLK